MHAPCMTAQAIAASVAAARGSKLNVNVCIAAKEGPESPLYAACSAGVSRERAFIK